MIIQAGGSTRNCKREQFGNSIPPKKISPLLGFSKPLGGPEKLICPPPLFS